MIVILFMTSFVRSFFFTGINVLGFADIERNQTSQATALNATIQQITGALGRRLRRHRAGNPCIAERPGTGARRASTSPSSASRC